MEVPSKIRNGDPPNPALGKKRSETWSISNGISSTNRVLIGFGGKTRFSTTFGGCFVQFLPLLGAYIKRCFLGKSLNFLRNPGLFLKTVNPQKSEVPCPAFDIFTSNAGSGVLRCKSQRETRLKRRS